MIIPEINPSDDIYPTLLRVKLQADAFSSSCQQRMTTLVAGGLFHIDNGFIAKVSAAEYK